MKRTRVVLFLAVLAIAGVLAAGRAEARPRARIVVPVPAIRIGMPVELVALPGTRMYYYPAEGADLFWYVGAWWMPWEGRWYRSASHDGPWVYVPGGRVPRAVSHLPGNPRHVYAAAPRMGYREWREHRHHHAVRPVKAPPHRGRH